MTIPVKIKLIHERARMPEYARPGDSGADLRCVEAVRLKFGEPQVVWFGLALELPPGFEGQIRPRSSLSKIGVHCALGTLDNGFRGPIGATLTLLNAGHSDFEIHIGHKVAQLVIAPVGFARFEAADELSSTERGEGGWGSSGR